MVTDGSHGDPRKQRQLKKQRQQRKQRQSMKQRQPMKQRLYSFNAAAADHALSGEAHILEHDRHAAGVDGRLVCVLRRHGVSAWCEKKAAEKWAIPHAVRLCRRGTCEAF